MGVTSRGGAIAAPRTADWRRAVRALRASHWWYFTPLPLVALVGDPAGDEHVALRLGAAMLVAALCLAYAYGLNGITDRAMDGNSAKNSLVGLVGIPREASMLVTACALGAICIAAALSLTALLGAGVSLGAATLYSAQLRLKRLPVVGTIVNVLIFAPLPLLAATHGPTSGMLFLTYCFWVLVTQNQILHEISDAREDATAGLRTTAVACGPVGVRMTAFVLGPLGALPLWWLQSSPAALYSAISGICVGAAMVALCSPQLARRLRAAHRWFSLATGIVLFVLVAGRSIA